MKYYLHDANAFNDDKITELFMEFGYEGLGLFYTILEKIALQEKPVKTTVLKQQLKVGKKLEKCWKFMESIGLISSNNGETFNEQLLKYSEKYQVKKEKNTERIREWRERQKDINNVTSNERVSNAPKVKESKVKESKVKEERENKFSPPSQSEVYDLMLEKGIDTSRAMAESLKFISHYTSNGWKVGKNKMQSWPAAVSGWITRMSGYENGKEKAGKVESLLSAGAGAGNILNQVFKDE